MGPLRVLLVDDHLLFRKGLARLLDAQTDFEVVGEAKDGREALEQARLLQPDLVLMDIRMPGCDGFEATRRIKSQLPQTHVVILTVSDDSEDLTAAIRHGADGYLLKDLLPESLFRQLRGLAAGEAPLSRAMTAKLLQELARRDRPAAAPTPSDTLSPREGQVLALIVDGYSNREIAAELGIARNTVKNHVRNLLAKLGAKNRAQAAARAISLRLVHLPEGGD
ncbi:MAG: response regulator transcription factor [Anaerolineales bacterium]|nr:MAG: response regulator transcription factor [Anaerolineales bacterium]